MNASAQMLRFGLVSGLALALTAGILAGPSEARSKSSPHGIWMDARGRGAIEIAPCGRNKVCGRIIWVSNKKERHGCGQMLLGDVRAMGGGQWDNGWIIDPDTRSKYDVALTRISRTRLKVTGYMGSKMFSRDIIWKLAPKGLQRCDGKKPQVIEAKAKAPVVIAAAGPKKAPAPVRNPMMLGASAIKVPVPVLVSPPRMVSRHSESVIAQKSPDAPLSEAAREALDLLAVPADSQDGGIPVLTHRRLASNKTCHIHAPFATVTFRCRR
ncbi:MAG: DUF2147 domain-containing protein [Filomicrobium sp.]